MSIQNDIEEIKHQKINNISQPELKDQLQNIFQEKIQKTKLEEAQKQELKQRKQQTPQTPQTPKLTPSEKRRRNRYLQTLMKKHLEELKTAKKSIMIYSKDQEPKLKEKSKEAIETINQMMKVSKSLTKSRGLFFGI